MKTLKDRILLHQEPFIRGLCQQELPPGEVTAILANALIHIKE